MVVGRALAVHAVGPHVGQQVVAELVERELRQIGIAVGQRQPDDQQRVELERAVVAVRV